ncbi:MAG: hypothetical protein JSS75_02395 [Bacteroidetes bacterium]|nr:hypothetical protein [Bacteroidota bacterium]
MTTHIRALVVLTFALLIAGCSKSSTSPNEGGSSDGVTLIPAKISTAQEPNVDASSVEDVWANASALTVSASPMSGGVNFVGANRTFPVTIKSLVSDQRIFFLVQYSDPSEDYLRTPIAFTGGNPADSTNWQTTPAYDDGVSFFFEMVPGTSDGGLQSFKANGCAALCHTTNGGWGPGMFAEDSGMYDVWYWHSGKSNGDGYAEDNTSQGDPTFGIVKDDANADDYRNNTLKFDSGYFPQRVAGGNNQQLDMLRFLAEETAAKFDPRKPNPATGTAWASGDRVPAYTIGNPTPGNDYFDVHSRGYYSNGQWTVKFSRDRVPQQFHQDVAFTSGKKYLFSFAIHDATPANNHYGAANKSFTLAIP